MISLANRPVLVARRHFYFFSISKNPQNDSVTKRIKVFCFIRLLFEGLIFKTIII